MNDEFAETSGQLTFTEDEAIVISPPSKEIESIRKNGSYTMTNKTLIVAVELSNASPTLRELKDLKFDFETMATVNKLEMASLLGVEIVPPLENERVPSSNEMEKVVENDDEYYLPMVDFEFENVQFLVPRWRFEETFPQSTLILPASQDTKVFTQDGVSAEDFRGLMEFMYPLGHSVDDSFHHSQSLVSVLKLASRWHMVEYRNQALTKIENNIWASISTNKIVLGRLCGIPTWYRKGCISFARGDTQLHWWHEEEIGIGTMVKIARARDAAYRETVVSYHKQIPAPASYLQSIPDILPTRGGVPSPSSRPTIIDDICTARANGLSSWLQSCYERLMVREESITLEELTSLGLETTLGIWQARLQLFKSYRVVLRSMSQRLPPLDFTRHVDAEFMNELEQAKLLQITIDPSSAEASTIGIKKKKGSIAAGTSS